MLDTRFGLGVRAGAVAAGDTVAFDAAGVADGASALVLNMTVVDPAGSGFATVYPCGQPRPDVSNLNFSPGVTIANLAVVRTGTGGRVCVFTSTTAHVLADISAYMPASSRFGALPAPVRLLDSRARPAGGRIDPIGRADLSALSADGSTAYLSWFGHSLDVVDLRTGTRSVIADDRCDIDLSTSDDGSRVYVGTQSVVCAAPGSNPPGRLWDRATGQWKTAPFSGGVLARNGQTVIHFDYTKLDLWDTSSGGNYNYPVTSNMTVPPIDSRDGRYIAVTMDSTVFGRQVGIYDTRLGGVFGSSIPVCAGTLSCQPVALSDDGLRIVVAVHTNTAGVDQFDLRSLPFAFLRGDIIAGSTSSVDTLVRVSPGGRFATRTFATPQGQRSFVDEIGGVEVELATPFPSAPDGVSADGRRALLHTPTTLGAERDYYVWTAP
jgi:hypothetical protein